MATALYVGNTNFRVVDTAEFEDSEGVDAVSITLQGDLNQLDTIKNTWTRGRVMSSLGYPNMYLQTKETRTGRSGFGLITLNGLGYLSATLSNPIEIADSISLQGTTLVTDETDSNGNAQNVQFKYYAQQTTTRWIHRGPSAPTYPRYKAVVPSTIPNNILFDPYPASYTGTPQKKIVGRLEQFDRVELATGVWGVLESWTIRLEPAD